MGPWCKTAPPLALLPPKQVGGRNSEIGVVEGVEGDSFNPQSVTFTIRDVVFLLMETSLMEKLYYYMAIWPGRPSQSLARFASTAPAGPAPGSRDLL